VNKTWTREQVLERLRTIIAQTRGVDEARVVDGATVFDDLTLEWIDFLEISFRIEEAFGFPFAVHETERFLSWAKRGGTDKELRGLLNVLCIHADIDTLPGRNPRNDAVFYQAVECLFTLEALVDFVLARLQQEGHAS